MTVKQRMEQLLAQSIDSLSHHAVKKQEAEHGRMEHDRQLARGHILMNLFLIKRIRERYKFRGCY